MITKAYFLCMNLPCVPMAAASRRVTHSLATTMLDSDGRTKRGSSSCDDESEEAREPLLLLLRTDIFLLVAAQQRGSKRQAVATSGGNRRWQTGGRWVAGLYEVRAQGRSHGTPRSQTP